MSKRTVNPHVYSPFILGENRGVLQSMSCQYMQSIGMKPIFSRVSAKGLALLSSTRSVNSESVIRTRMALRIQFWI